MKGFFLWLVAGFFALASLSAGAEEATAPVPHWTTSGKTILDPQGKPIRLRGFNVCWWVPPTEQDAIDIQQLGGNCVRYMFGYQPKGVYDPSQIGEVEEQIRAFTKHGIWVIPVLYTFEKPNPADPKKKLGPWHSEEMNREYLALWSDLIGRMKGDPYIAAWEPINEPHDVDPALVAAWYREVIPQFRKLDPDRPLVVEGANYSHAEDLTDLFLMEAPNIIYAFHFYDPYDYTTDLKTPPVDYPGNTGGKAHLEQLISKAKDFRDRHQVPVWCGEWGVKTGAPHYQVWSQDVFAILEANQFDWCIWAWARQPKDLHTTSFDINKDKAETYRFFADLFAGLKKDPAAPSP